MVDYYPLIARAVAGLEPSAPGESRRAIYERARNALTVQLGGVDPPLSESEITRQRLSLEEAVRKVESEAGQRTRNGVAVVVDYARRMTRKDAGARKNAAAQNLAEMAERLEAALRGPTADLRRAAARPQRDDASAQRPAGEPRREDVGPQGAALILELQRLRQAFDPETSDGVPTAQARRPAREGWQEEADRKRVLDETAAATARLRARLGEEGAEEEIRRPFGPPSNAIPEQDLSRAIGFNPTRTGPLDLVRDPPTDPYDQEQSLLYTRIRRQLSKLKQDIPSQERSQVDDAIDDFLEQPAEWSKVENKKILWLSGNSLRALLAQSDSVRSDPEHYSKLPPSVAEGMRHPVQAWSIFVQGDPGMALLDKYSLGPQEQQSVLNNLAAVEGILAKTVEDRNLLTNRAANAINAAMKSASSTSKDINTRLAQELADNTSKHLFSQILRRAYLLRDAIVDPSSPAAMELRLDLAKGARQAAGGIALSAVLAGGAHVLPYFEFIATNPMIIKEYILVAFQNSQMGEIVDAIEFEYNRLRVLLK